MEVSVEAILIIGLTFVLAGMVKGVVGLGLPTVSLALLTSVYGLADAVALMVVPSLVTNIWQGLVGGQLAAILKRLWPMLLAAFVCTVLASSLLESGDLRWLTLVLAASLLTYASYGLLAPKLPEPGRHEGWLTPTVGVCNGVLTGMTGSFVFPGTAYLQTLGLSRDTLIQAMGVLYTVSTAALAVSLSGRNLYPADLGIASALALVPAALGMVVGQRVRARLSEALFRRVFFISILALAAYIGIRSVLSLTAS